MKNRTRYFAVLTDLDVLPASAPGCVITHRHAVSLRLEPDTYFDTTERDKGSLYVAPSYRTAVGIAKAAVAKWIADVEPIGTLRRDRSELAAGGAFGCESARVIKVMPVTAE